MKLVHVATLDSGYLAQLYERVPSLASSSFTQQLAALADDCFAQNNAWNATLGSYGYEVSSLYTNAEPLQRAWASENGVPWTADWRHSILSCQISQLQPDIIYFDDERTFRPAFFDHLRDICHRPVLVAGWTASPHRDEDAVKAWDVVVSCAKAVVEEFAILGCAAFHLPHAFNRNVLQKVHPPEERRQCVVFSGSLSLTRKSGPMSHRDRELMLEALQSEVPLEIYTPAYQMSAVSDFAETLARCGAYVAMQALARMRVSYARRRDLPFIGRAASWTEMPSRRFNATLHRLMKPPVYGIAMYELLCSTAVALNQSPGTNADNMRLFEVTGIGSCLLNDFKPNLAEYFELDREIVVYRGSEECVEKAKWLLRNPKRREEIAKAGQARTLRDHTFQNRAAALAEILKVNLHRAR
jgi:spore maturation protein CgeB